MTAISHQKTGVRCVLNIKMNRDTQKENYRFNEADHIHELLVNGEWKPLIGISSVVKDITNFGMAAYYGSRRALMELGYDPKDSPEATESFIQRAKELCDKSPEEIKKALKKAYTAHSTYAKSRADKGTDSHAILQKWAEECIKAGKLVESNEEKVQTFLKLAKPHLGNFTIIASEKHGHNEELWIGGICDLIVKTEDGRIAIVDFKDRPAIYPKDMIQMFGYSLLFPHKTDFILGVPLEGTEAWAYHLVERGQEIFKAQLEVYNFLNQFN